MRPWAQQSRTETDDALARGPREGHYVVESGDSWASLAARFYGNASLGRALAGQNGAHEDSHPVPGTEIDVSSAVTGSPS